MATRQTRRTTASSASKSATRTSTRRSASSIVPSASPRQGNINNLILQLAYAGLPTPEPEYKFAWEAMRRKWRFDLCWRDARLAVEVDGGIWTNGRHSRGSGYEPDCEKLNAAVLLGWRVLRFTYGMVDSGLALLTIEKALAQSQPTSATVME